MLRRVLSMIPMMLVQTQWEPLVPHVTINLYQEGLAADGVTKTLTAG